MLHVYCVRGKEGREFFLLVILANIYLKKSLQLDHHQYDNLIKYCKCLIIKFAKKKKHFHIGLDQM